VIEGTRMHAADDYIADVEAKLREWDRELADMEGCARERLAQGIEGSEAEIGILEELKRKQMEMRVRINALRIVREGGMEALRSDTERLVHAFEQTFARSTLLRAPD
jgi:hypothetical protein